MFWVAVYELYQDWTAVAPTQQRRFGAVMQERENVF